MNAAERRDKIKSLLHSADKPLSAGNLAMEFAVSRQIIVGDIALMRAAGQHILATPRGYILEREEESDYFEHSLACTHNAAQVADELYTVIDHGGGVIDVTVDHSVYGEISAPLHLFSRFDIDEFLRKLETSHARPLSALTDGIHLHRIRCKNEVVFQRVEQALREKGYLYEKSSR